MDIAHLGGARGDEENTDLFGLQLGVFAFGLFAGLDGRDLHRRHNGKKIVFQIRKAQRDQARDHRARGGDHGFFDVIRFQVRAGIRRNHFGGLRHLVDLVEADATEPFEHVVHVFKPVELTVKRGCGKRHLPFVVHIMLKL